MQASSLVVFAVIATLLGALPPLRADAIVTAVVFGALSAFLLAALYRALALGPIAVVSPLVAANAAVTVVLAVALLDEVLTPLQVAAIVATITGVALASTDLRLLRAGLQVNEGIRLAFVALVGFGVLGLLFATGARAYGSLGMVLLARIATPAFLALFAAGRRADLRVPRGAIGIVVLIGLLDTSANVAFGLGAISGYASIVATGASSYPLIPFVLGVTLLRERIAPNQLAGIALLLGGLVTLGLAG